MSGFGERLRKLRRNADITQRQLAEYLGVTYAAVGKYECLPSAYPSIEALIKIADYFHVSTDYLLRGTEPYLPKENTESAINIERSLSPEAEELLKIYCALGVRDRLKLLNFAVELEEKKQ